METVKKSNNKSSKCIIGIRRHNIFHNKIINLLCIKMGLTLIRTNMLMRVNQEKLYNNILVINKY